MRMGTCRGVSSCTSVAPGLSLAPQPVSHTPSLPFLRGALLPSLPLPRVWYPHTGPQTQTVAGCVLVWTEQIVKRDLDIPNQNSSRCYFLKLTRGFWNVYGNVKGLVEPKWFWKRSSRMCTPCGQNLPGGGECREEACTGEGTQNNVQDGVTRGQPHPAGWPGFYRPEKATPWVGTVFVTNKASVIFCPHGEWKDKRALGLNSLHALDTETQALGLNTHFSCDTWGGKQGAKGRDLAL